MVIAFRSKTNFNRQTRDWNTLPFPRTGRRWATFLRMTGSGCRSNDTRSLSLSRSNTWQQPGAKFFTPAKSYLGGVTYKGPGPTSRLTLILRNADLRWAEPLRLSSGHLRESLYAYPGRHRSAEFGAPHLRRAVSCDEFRATHWALTRHFCSGKWWGANAEPFALFNGGRIITYVR